MKITHDLRGHLYCGPAAIAAVTGRLTSEVQAAVRRGRLDRGLGGGRSGRGIIGWMLLREIVPALILLGSNGIQHVMHRKPSLEQFLNERIIDHPIIVLAGTHFMVMHYDQWIDNDLSQGIRPLSSLPRLRRRVYGYVEVLSC